MRIKTIALAGIIVSGGLGAAVLAPPVAPAQTSAADAAIVRSFRSVVRRDPSERELLRYRTLMVRNGWTAADVRRDPDAEGLRLSRDKMAGRAGPNRT